jgi:hypothetical protein
MYMHGSGIYSGYSTDSENLNHHNDDHDELEGQVPSPDARASTQAGTQAT